MRSEEEIRKMLKAAKALLDIIETSKGEKVEYFTVGFVEALKWILEEE